MADNESQQTETIKILASIQTTNEFILKGMGELKTEMGRVGESVHAHALTIQSHATDIAVARRDAENAATKANALEMRVSASETLIAGLPAQKSHWSSSYITVAGTVASAILIIFQILKLLIDHAFPTTK